MALPDTIKHAGGSSRTTGIAAANIAAGANALGSEIDNSTNKDTECDIEVSITCGVAPTADKVMEVYILYALDGTNYEDGNAVGPVDPKKAPVGCVAVRAVTSAQKCVISGVPLRPYKFKVLLKSELDQTATTTVLLYSNNPQIVE